MDIAFNVRDDTFALIDNDGSVGDDLQFSKWQTMNNGAVENERGSHGTRFRKTEKQKNLVL